MSRLFNFSRWWTLLYWIFIILKLFLPGWVWRARVTTFLENWKCQGIMQLSGKCQGIDLLSGECQRKYCAVFQCHSELSLVVYVKMWICIFYQSFIKKNFHKSSCVSSVSSHLISKASNLTIVPNLIKISQTVFEISQFLDFSRWQPSTILDLFGVYLDKWRVVGGLYPHVENIYMLQMCMHCSRLSNTCTNAIAGENVRCWVSFVLFNISKACYLFCQFLVISCQWLLYYVLCNPSVLWRCWLGVRKGIRPVKNWVVGCWRGCLHGVQTCI